MTRTLKGITWNHSRGITPLQAASQRYAELNPGIDIEWQKRSLQEFADFNIEELAGRFDLLIIDHPWVGRAEASSCVLPLDNYLPDIYLKEQELHSVGGSHQSYFYGQHQWALAIDAATQMASSREDLLQLNGEMVPEHWDDVIRLARKGRVAAASIPIDLLMSFYMLCIAHGTEPFLHDEMVIDEETGLRVLDTMRDFWSLLDKKLFSLNPIAVAEWMCSEDSLWYCPFAYGYSNYCRKGYAKNLLTYHDLVYFNESERLRSTVGGTGLAVSAFSAQIPVAVHFAGWLASPEIQATVFVQNGGQPGHRLAWEDEDANRITRNFFRNTLGTMDRGYIRPRYNGYLDFQDQAGEPLHHFLMNGGNAQKVLEKFNLIYRASKKIK